MGDNKSDEAELETLKADMESATLKIQSLEDEIKVLKEKLEHYETEETSVEKEANVEPEVDSTDGNVPPESADAAE